MGNQIKWAERSNRLEASAIRNKLFDEPDILTFAAGKPESSAFPYIELVDVAKEVLEQKGQSALQYSSTDGIYELRKLIAEDRMKAWGVNTDPEHLMMLSGSQEGIEMSGKIFVDPGSKVIVENPSYLGAYTALRIYNPHWLTVGMDEHGMKMDELEDILHKNDDVRMIYTVPDFQNPTGVVMSVERRKQLAQLAAKYGVIVVEDRPYGDLCYDGDPYPAVKSFDEEGWVVTLGSFSKIFCPGFRLAWICAEPEILQKFNMAKQGSNLQVSTFDENLAIGWMKKYSLADRITKLCDLYRSRRDTIVRCMEEYFPKEIAFNRPEGGFFTWLTLREDMDAREIANEAAMKLRVACIPGTPFYAYNDIHNNIRLNFSFINEETIEEGIRRLGTLLHEKYGC